MKNKLILFAVGTIAFMLLFYKKWIGLNLGIFGLVLSLGMIALHFNKPKNKAFYLLFAGSVLSSLAFAWYVDFISFVSLFISLSLFSIYLFYPKFKFILATFLLPLNFVLAVPMFFLQKNSMLSKWRNKSDFKWVYQLLIPLVVLSAFVLVYAIASPKLSDFLLKLDFDEDVLYFIYLLIFGLIVNYFFWYFNIPEKWSLHTLKLSKNFPELTEPKNNSYEWEQKSAKITLIGLNVLLFCFLGFYTYELFGEPNYVDSISDAVHERVYAVIFSILMAIGVIFYFFRNRLSFVEKSKDLKAYALLWIGLNALLVLIAVLKNVEYVDLLGLTEKRLGVFTFLGMSFLGLFFTWKKMTLQKTNWYIVHPMVRATYIVIVLMAVVNWSWLITKYNISLEKMDEYYLDSLPYNKYLLYEELGTDYYKSYNTDILTLDLEDRMYDWYVANKIAEAK